MSPEEHYAEAERLLAAECDSLYGSEWEVWRSRVIAQAQVHATLALAAGPTTVVHHLESSVDAEALLRTVKPGKWGTR